MKGNRKGGGVGGQQPLERHWNKTSTHLLPDLRLLLGGEVVDNVEAAQSKRRDGRANGNEEGGVPSVRGSRSTFQLTQHVQLADLLGLLSLDHVGDRLATNVAASGDGRCQFRPRSCG